MTSLSDNYVLDAIQAERDGESFPVEFDIIFPAFGFKDRDSARQYIRRNAKTLIELNLMQDPLQLKGSKNQLRDFDKYYLSVKGFKFALARAKTEKGALYLLHLLSLEEQFLASLERALNPAINPQIDATRFDYCFDAAIQVTAHRNKYDTQKRLLTYLDEGKDYQWDGATLWLSNPIYYSFIAASRTVKGIDVEKIGQTVVLDWQYYCRVCKALKSPKNAMFPRNRFKPVGKYKQLEIEV